MKQKLTYFYSLLLTALFLLPWNGAKAETLTVANGTKTTYQTPVYGYYCDRYVRSQIIYPASMLTSMNGNNITAMTFYFETPSSNALSSTFQLYLKEVASTTTALSTSWMDMTGATKVFEGTIEANNTTTNTLVIEFDTPFSYNGGSLIFDLKNTASGGSYAAKKWGEYTCVFYGRKAAADESSTLTGYASSATITPTRGDIRPKTTFTYEEASSGGSSTCAVPTAVTATQNNPAKATLSWTKAEGKDNYQYLYVAKDGTPDWTGVTAQNTNSVELDGLTAGVEYDFYVRTYCDAGDGNQSDAVKKTFSVTCPAPTAPQVTNIATTTATLSWTEAAGISNYQYIVVERGAAEDWTSPTLVEGSVTTPLSGLTAGTKYDVYVRSYYNATTVSASVKAQFATPCNAMSYADFNGTFESETAGSGLMPNCWEAAATYDYTNYYSSTSTTYPCVKVNYSTSEGDQCLAFHGGQNSTKNIAVLPVLSEELNTLTISFQYKNGGTSSYYGQFSVGYYKNGTFTAFADGTLTRNSSFTLFEMAIPTVPSGARLAIQYAGGTYYNAESFIDEISLYPTPSCTKPSGVTVSNIVYNGATVTWTEDGSATNWKVQYSTDNTNWTTVNVSENPTCTLSGLTTGTPYHVQVISVCGGTDGESPAVAAASTFTPTCQTPGVPSASEKTTNSAKISWVVNSGEAEWNLQYKKSSDANYTTLASITENPYTLNGLSSGTTYQVRVAATCNGTYTTAASFDTECEAKNLASYTEGFEGFTTGSYAQTGLTCWGELNAVHSSSYSYPQMYVNTNSSYVKSGSKSLYLVSSSSTYEYAILPIFSGSYAGYQLTFSHKEESASSSGKITLGYLTDASDASTFNVIKEFTRAESWTTETEIINDVPDGARLAFRYGGGSNNYYAGIDDISISAAPSCAKPTNLAVSEIGTNSAKVTWESEASNFALEYKKTSDENWTAATGTIASPFVLSGLAANQTEYTVRVQAICGETPSDWVELTTPFETECVNKTVTEETAWTENFEAQTVDKLPACWSEVSSYAISAYTQVNASAAKESDLGVQVYTYGTNTEIAILPTFTEEIKNLKISFDYKNYNTGSNYAALEVGYYSGGAFTNVTTLDKTTSFVASGEIEMPKTAPDGARIAFRVVGKKSGYNGSAYIDNISVIRKPACAVPTITAANATSDGAIVTWTPGDEESQWNLRYSVKDADTWTVLENKTSGFALTGLSVGTTYEVQVQAYCDATHQSAWSASTEFAPVCNAPTALAVTARTQNSAAFSWTSTESAWVLQYSTDGENWESENVATNPFTLSGLTAGTTYQAKIQSACGSDFSNVVTFTTWCDSKLSLPTNISSFSAVPACWEVSPAGAVTIASSKLCFTGEGEKFLYLPQTNINLNLLSITLTFSGSLELGYISEPNGAFTQLVASPVSGTEYDLATLAPESAQYLAIRYNGANSWASASISAISIRKTPTCLKPTGVAGAPGVGSASISWTENGSAEAWNLQYKKASEANYTTVAVTENPYALNGLEQGLAYKVRVQANCGEELSDWSDEASFITDCEGIAALPWYADFSQALSNCWTIYAESSSSYYIPAANTTMNELKLDGGKAGNSNNVVVLPAFSASLTNAVMSFEYYGSTGASNAQLEAGYMTDKDDASTFTALQTLEQAGSYTEARVALNTVPAGNYLAFRVAGASSQTDMRVKNLRVINAVTLADGENNADKLSANLNKTVDVTLGRTIFCDGDYNTICLPFDMSEEELAASPLAGAAFKAFKYAVIEPEELQVRVIDVEGGLQAGVPYLLKKTGDDIVNPLFKNVTISATAGKTIGEDEPVEFIGTFTPVAFAAGDANTLFVYTNNNLTWSAENSNLKAFRAYFNRTATAGAPLRHGMRARIVEYTETATGIEDVRGGVQSIKVLENNQVVIIRNGVKYSIQGQKIQ